MKNIKLFEKFAVNESEKTPDDLFRINGCGLFNWDCQERLSIEEMIAILDWYESLPEDKKEFVDILRREEGISGSESMEAPEGWE